MAREFARKFYNSKDWLTCRETYIAKMPKYKRGLCEKCYSNGIYKPGVELHHKIILSPKNINDPNVTLNHDNLIFLCFECHKKIHQKSSQTKRYIIDKDGNVLPLVPSLK